MISDPLNFVYATVTRALAIVNLQPKRVVRRDQAEVVTMSTEQSSTKERKRHWIQFTFSKAHPDTSLPPLTASINITIDRPSGAGITGFPGFTVTEIEGIVNDVKTALTTTPTTGLVAKLYGGEL